MARVESRRRNERDVQGKEGGGGMGGTARGREGGKEMREGGRTLTRQISSESVHSVGFRWPKTTIFLANFDIWGTPVPTPFYR